VIEAKFTIAAGDYQNVKIRIQGDDIECFTRELEALDDALKVKLGIMHAELDSWITDAYNKAFSGDTDAAEKLLKDALGATTIEVVDNKPKPEQTAEFVTPTVKKQTPPWEKNGEDW
jgi:hypothetical protein